MSAFGSAVPRFHDGYFVTATIVPVESLNNSLGAGLARIKVYLSTCSLHVGLGALDACDFLESGFHTGSTSHRSVHS